MKKINISATAKKSSAAALAILAAGGCCWLAPAEKSTNEYDELITQGENTAAVVVIETPAATVSVVHAGSDQPSAAAAEAAAAVKGEVEAASDAVKSAAAEAAAEKPQSPISEAAKTVEAVSDAAAKSVEAASDETVAAATAEKFKEKRDRQHSVWAVFSRLDQDEQRKMLELQKNDPAKFEEAMAQKIKSYNDSRAKRTVELRAMAQQVNEAKSEEERMMLRNKLVDEIKKDFNNRIAEHRRSVENMKARALKLEAELDRRAAGVEAAAQKAATMMIDGKKPAAASQSK
jgi:hypothetical protein